MEPVSLYSSRNKTLGTSKRIKISRACDECRKRKVKCDGVQPCGRCKKSNAECVFAKLPPKRGPPKQYMESLENRLQRVEKALKSMTVVRKVFDEAEKKTKIPEAAKKSVSYSAPYTSDLQAERFSINEIGQAVYVNDYKSRMDRIPNEIYQQAHDTQSDISDSPISSSSFFHTPLLQLPPQPCVVIEVPIPDHLSSRHLISELQPLTEVYFDHVHKYVPMIHKPSFLKQMHSISNPPSRFLLLAMCAVASRWSPDQVASSTTSKRNTPAGYAYYQRAFELLDDFIDAPRISTVQALILLVKYQEYFHRDGFFHRSYLYLGMAVQMSFDLGLSQLVESEAQDAETKRRTFWVIFMYDLLSSIEQGRDTFFQVQQCKTGFPLVTGEEGPALEELVTNQNILIQLGKVLSDIHVMSRSIAKRQKNQGNKRTQEQTIEEQARLFSLHTHLENFLYEVPPTLVYPPTQDTESYPVEVQLIGDPFIGFLHMTYHFSVILLHRIYTSLSPPKTEYNFISYPHRKLCAASASNITMITKTLLEMYPSYTFNYPTRGTQHTIHCLAAAATIHKYEMRHAPDELTQEAANDQLALTLELMQQLSYESPSTETYTYFKQPAPPVRNHIYTGKPKERRNTLSTTMDEPVLYQSSASMTDPHIANFLAQQQQQQQQYHGQPRYNTYPQMSMPQWQMPAAEDLNYRAFQVTNSWNQSQPYYDTPPPQYPESMMVAGNQQQKQPYTNRTRRHTVSSQESTYLDHLMIPVIKKQQSFDPSTLNMDMMLVGDEDAIMMDTPHHYDPTPGMSQLFLTDQQQIAWDGSLISEARSEGHVMK